MHASKGIADKFPLAHVLRTIHGKIYYGFRIGRAVLGAIHIKIPRPFPVIEHGRIRTIVPENRILVGCHQEAFVQIVLYRLVIPNRIPAGKEGNSQQNINKNSEYVFHKAIVLSVRPTRILIQLGIHLYFLGRDWPCAHIITQGIPGVSSLPPHLHEAVGIHRTPFA